MIVRLRRISCSQIPMLLFDNCLSTQAKDTDGVEQDDEKIEEAHGQIGG